LAELIWTNLAVVSVDQLAGGAMPDTIGSHWSTFGLINPKTMHMVSLSCLSTNST